MNSSNVYGRLLRDGSASSVVGYQQLTFSIHLAYDEARVFYTGKKNRVQVTADNGKTLNLPWSSLQPYLTVAGLTGRFVITHNELGKLISLERLT